MQWGAFPPTVGAPFPQASRRIPWRENEPHGSIIFPTPNASFRRSAFAGLVLGGLLANAHAAPLLTADIPPRGDGRLVTDDGTVSLRWTGGGRYELQQAADSSFATARTRYEGADRGTVLTGLTDGIHHFRVRDAATGEWSAPLALHAESMSQAALLLLLGTGAFVALSTVGAILHGFLKSR